MVIWAKAQTSGFITEIEVSVDELTSAQNERYQKILAQESVVNTWFVDLADLSSIAENGWITLSMPDKDCTAAVKAKYVSSDESNDFYWYGEVIKEDGDTEEACQCYEGFVNIMRHEGEMIGSISLDEDRYEIQSIGDERTVLVKKDVTGLNLHCSNDGSSGGIIDGGGGGGQTLTPKSNGNCPVKVLALFTPNGNNAVANIENTINLSIAQTNQALKNSQVSECDLELILVDVQEIQFAEGYYIPEDLDLLIGNTTVQALRDAAHADIVVIYTDGAYGGVIGRAGRLHLNADSAMCVVEAAEAITEFNTAHEIAHLFGCRHQPEDDPTGPFEHAHEFKTGCWPFRKRKNTVVFSVATGRTIQHYSNPNVLFKNKPTGVIDERENWRKLKESACIVANFRDDAMEPILNASISGEGYNCPCYSVGLEAQVSGGAPGPYSFEWRTSTDGFNWGSVQSILSSFAVALPCEVGEGVYVRLTVTSSDGQVDDSYRFVEAAESWPGQQGECPKFLVSNDDNVIFGGGNLFPNPVRDVLIFQISEDEDMPSDVVVVDVWGRHVVVRPEVASVERTIRIPTGHLPDGVYSLRYGTSKTLKFVKVSN